MACIVGIDGGGTKTAFLGYCTETGTVTRAEGGSIAPQDHGLETFQRIIWEGVESLTVGSPEASVAVCAGIPCWGEDKRWDAKTAEVLRRMFPESTVTCVNDCVVGYAGALGLQPGINIVAGTGAIAYGENAAGCSARSNGWSSEFSDEGSCFWLGRQSLALFCKQADGRLPKMALYEIIRAHFAITDDFEIVRIYEKRYKGRRRETANLQRLLCQAAIHGDDSARLAYEQAARELAQSIEAVRLSLKMTGELSVSYSGGLFRTGALILDPLRQALDAAYGSYRLQKPAYSPEAGALLLAAESVGCPLGAIKQTILGAEGSNDQQ